jgi:thiol-disulfide isomerase/thioredoxin
MKKLFGLSLLCILIASYAVYAAESNKKDETCATNADVSCSMSKDATTSKENISRYLDYKVGIVTEQVKSGKTVVLFFHADRCPTCVSLDKDIKNNLKTIPNDVVIVKANYDTAKNLKKLYKVKSQNSLVAVNKKGKIVARSKGATTTVKDLLRLVK